MLDGLGCGQKAGIESSRALVLGHDFLALIENAHDGIAGLALGPSLDRRKN